MTDAKKYNLIFQVREEYKNAFVRWKTGDKTYGRPRQRRVYVSHLVVTFSPSGL